MKQIPRNRTLRAAIRVRLDADGAVDRTEGEPLRDGWGEPNDTASGLYHLEDAIDRGDAVFTPTTGHDRYTHLLTWADPTNEFGELRHFLIRIDHIHWRHRDRRDTPT